MVRQGVPTGTRLLALTLAWTCALAVGALPSRAAAGSEAGAAWPLATSETFVEAANGNRLYVRVVQPDPAAAAGRRFPAVVVVPGGTGDGAPLADRADMRQLAASGFVVVAFNPQGRGTDLPGNLRSDGVEDCGGRVHQDDLETVVAHAATLAAADNDNLGVVTFSLGIAIGAGALGRHPELPVAYLIDWEGPHDSRVVTFLESGHEREVCGHLSLDTDPSPDNQAFWEEREAVRWIGGFTGHYLRLQAEVDHAQGPGVFRHAFEMIAASTSPSHGGSGLAAWTRMNTALFGNPANTVYSAAAAPAWVPGRLADHPGLVVDAVIEMAQTVGRGTVGRARRRLRSTPSATHASPFGFHPAEVSKPGYAANGYADALDLGIGWTRPQVYAYWFMIQPELGVAEYDFTFHDDLYGRVPPGINILANVAPQGNLDEGRCLPDSFVPVDVAAYEAFVRAVVERYDGDGVDDMPGLANPIRYWQVGNEPTTQQATDFAELQRITYRAVKAACPSCLVLIGGATEMPPVDGYLHTFDARFKPILEALGGECVDIMDFHWYGAADGDYLGARDVLAHVREALDDAGFGPIPVWITEMGTYSGDPVPVRPGSTDFPAQSEAEQAADLLKRHVDPFACGVAKVFPAFGLVEGFRHDGGYFDHTGLIYDGEGDGDPGLGVRKLAYYTYKLMTETLAGSDWTTVETVLDAGGLHGVRVLRNGAPVFVVWWDTFSDPGYLPGDTVAVSLDGLPGSEAVVTEAVPCYSSGAEVPDYATAFARRTVPVIGGSVTFEVGESPVFVTVPGG